MERQCFEMEVQPLISTKKDKSTPKTMHTDIKETQINGRPNNYLQNKPFVQKFLKEKNIYCCLYK